MVSEKVKIINKTGLHARPASEFVKCAKKYKSNIVIYKDNGPEVSAKNIIMIMSQAFVGGNEITIRAEASDEEEAINSLSKLVRSGFGEPGML